MGEHHRGHLWENTIEAISVLVYGVIGGQRNVDMCSSGDSSCDFN